MTREIKIVGELVQIVETTVVKEGTLEATLPFLETRIPVIMPILPNNNLRAATGKQITMKVSVDPALLGGVVARVGSTVYDGSIRTQLKKMRDQLVAQG